MAANINDKFSRVSTGQRPSSTTVSTNRSSSATTLVCDDLTGWTTADAVHFVTYKLDSSGGIVSGSQTDFKGIVSGNSLTNIIITGGTDNGNSVGDVVVALPTAAWAKDLSDGLLVAHNQDGSLKSGAVNTPAIADDAVTAGKISKAPGEIGGVWQSWTPTLTGFSGSPTIAEAKYIKIGTTVHCRIRVSGTSNATTKFFTLPVPPNVSSGVDYSLGLSLNSAGSASLIGAALLRAATSNVQVFAGFNRQDTSYHHWATAWPASGSVEIILSFTYEAAS